MLCLREQRIRQGGRETSAIERAVREQRFEESTLFVRFLRVVEKFGLSIAITSRQTIFERDEFAENATFDHPDVGWGAFPVRWATSIPWPRPTSASGFR